MSRHRTQLLLERTQYYHLKRRAAAEDRSLSEIVRELIAADMAGHASARDRDPLWRLVGHFNGGEPGDTSERVDELVYGG